MVTSKVLIKRLCFKRACGLISVLISYLKRTHGDQKSVGVAHVAHGGEASLGGGQAARTKHAIRTTECHTAVAVRE